MDKSKYLKSLQDFEAIFKFAMKLSLDTHGRQVDTRREAVASYIFTKICLHANSILKLTPKSSYSHTKDKSNIWDYTSIAILSRAIMDAYYALFYLCIDKINNEEQEFRFLIWDYHSENRRLKQLRLIKSSNKEIPEIEKNVDELKELIKNNSEFKILDKNTRKGVIRGEIPFILKNHEIAERAGINKSYHQASYMFLSSYIHTFPFAISQTSAIEDTDQILHFINVILDMCYGYLCLCVRDYIELVPDQKVYLVGALKEKIEMWEEIFKELFK
ncbi:hypothetical protein B1H10_02220 [candidate division KSB1 bacterium 4484_188]|nr:MAG: hypothetical protein B1H10_02220 [candidate division KSB1 bacterium 4484_188]